VRARDVELASLVSSSRFARDAEGALLATVGDPPVDAILWLLRALEVDGAAAERIANVAGTRARPCHTSVIPEGYHT
jgi:hypothetical protein